MASQRAFYSEKFITFLGANPQAILGELVLGQRGDLTSTQRDAWLQQINILKQALSGLPDGTVLFEYSVPRMGKRVDTILLVGHTVVVIEFKVNAPSYERASINQAVDYALDLKNFHAGSCHAIIVPILVSTEAPDISSEPKMAPDGVSEILLANAGNLKAVIVRAINFGSAPPIDLQTWLAAGYRPTPTIIEASQALYRGHSVAEITRHEAGADNLGQTTDALGSIIDQACQTGEKAICLVTGVPGAGKTLAGLNLANERRRIDANEEKHAVFLSGNGPLVDVLREALVRDDVKQGELRGKTITKKHAAAEVEAFIQNVHAFRDECLANPQPPPERVVVFDEAQRAWNRDQTAEFMRRKRDRPSFDQSEPEFLIGAMDRHTGWAVIVCLVGGGQEINTGEAGMEEWLRALRDRFPAWKIYLPPQLQGQDYLPTFRLDDLGPRLNLENRLHLGVSLRSFRSERLSAAVAALLTGNAENTRAEMNRIRETYPMVRTRSLDKAKHWVRTKARGSERFGLLASSGARRLKPLGIHVATKIDPCHWFLEDDQDVRSSFYLEDAATEFDVQGLELDWAIVMWDGDFVYGDGGWLFRNFRGTEWENISDEQRRRYRLNAYRVLLTRARQGLVIVVPEGDARDRTRPRSNFDPTWEFLFQAGVSEI